MAKKSMQQSIENHLRILALLRDEGPKSAVEIRKATKIHPNTLYDLLDRLVKTKWAIKVEESNYAGKYAYYWFKDLEWELEKTLKTDFPHIINSGCIIANMNLLIPLARKLKVPVNDEFRNALDKVIERLGLTKLEVK